MGGISPTLGNYSQLNTLDLSMNLFTRLISSKLGELNSPIVLDLSYNAFTEKIPSILN
jgi:Leucine-rich repeat (LRR) protein